MRGGGGLKKGGPEGWGVDALICFLIEGLWGGYLSFCYRLDFWVCLGLFIVGLGDDSCFLEEIALLVRAGNIPTRAFFACLRFL